MVIKSFQFILSLVVTPGTACCFLRSIEFSILPVALKVHNINLYPYFTPYYII